MDSVPMWALFAGTIILVVAAIDVGYKLGRRSHVRSADEKEAPAAGVSGAVVGLLAFMLAFTFSIVSERHDARIALVREEANTLRTVYRRADFLPEADRDEARQLVREYLFARVKFAQETRVDGARISEFLAGAERMHNRLWEVAVVNARKDMNSDVAALYIQSLDDMLSVHANRVELGVQARLPIGIWAALFALTFLGMLTIGYHSGVAGSRRSVTAVILAVAFALVIAMITALDRPGEFISVTQRPLIELQRLIAPEPP